MLVGIQPILVGAGYKKLQADVYPAMTSNTAPSGHIITTSAPNAQNPEWRVFDKIIRTNTNYDWFGNGQDHYVQRQLPTSDRIWRYGVRVLNSGIPVAWQLLGSNDGNNFIVLDTYDSGAPNANSITYRNIPRPSISRFNRYRLRMTQTSGGGFIAISELELLKEV